MKKSTADLTPIGRVIVKAIDGKMSREQLAVRAGMESGNMSKLLRGVSPLGEDRLERIWRAAEVSIDEYQRVWLPALDETRQERKSRLMSGRIERRTAESVTPEDLLAAFRVLQAELRADQAALRAEVLAELEALKAVTNAEAEPASRYTRGRAVVIPLHPSIVYSYHDRPRLAASSFGPTLPRRVSRPRPLPGGPQAAWLATEVSPWTH